MPEPTPDSVPRGRPRGTASFPWRALFQQSDTPVFVLGKHRRLRFANAAWERVAGTKLADALGTVCTARRHSSRLAAAMAPTPEALVGRPSHARRPAPAHRSGPPWWDVTFVPLAGNDGPLGIVGFVTVVGDSDAVASRKVPPVVAAVRDRLVRAFPLDLLAGESPAAERLLAQARLAARAGIPVWLHGPAGAGKQTAARVLHGAGPHRERAFAAVDCEALPPYLIEALLFGHGGPAGTDRLGAVYLREPAALPRDFQLRLFEWLADGRPAAPRVLCGSVRPPADDVRDGRLLPEYRTEFGAFEIELRPLRERLDDLPRLVAHFLERAAPPGEPARAIEPSALEVLRAQPWPGNLRELADAVAGAVGRAGGGPIAADHLPHEMRVRAGPSHRATAAPNLNRDPLLKEVERRLIRLALARAKGSTKQAAELLGLTRGELAKRLKALEIEPRSE